MLLQQFFRSGKGHVPAARKRSHQWRVSLTPTILKQLKEWHVIVSCNQLGETLQAAPTLPSGNAGFFKLTY